jgi:hypothetical protein
MSHRIASFGTVLVLAALAGVTPIRPVAGQTTVSAAEALDLLAVTAVRRTFEPFQGDSAYFFGPVLLDEGAIRRRAGHQAEAIIAALRADPLWRGREVVAVESLEEALLMAVDHPEQVRFLEDETRRRLGLPRLSEVPAESGRRSALWMRDAGLYVGINRLERLGPGVYEISVDVRYSRLGPMFGGTVARYRATSTGVFWRLVSTGTVIRQ